MNNIVLIYKKSLYQIYFLERGQQVADSANQFGPEDRARLQASHDRHVGALAEIESELVARGLRYRKVYRARQLDFAPFDLVISVGGDGTFLEAARWTTDQTILGVNSDPGRSAGVFCPASAENFGEYLDRIEAGTARSRRVNRLALRLDGEVHRFAVVNEVLVAHRWPGMLSRYRLTIDGVGEVQRGSGIYIGTAAGSTGVIRSAGGKAMPLGSRRMQYLPRELNRGLGETYRFTGGIVAGEEPVVVRSMMREGMVFVDGAHLRLALPYNSVLELQNAAHPLQMVTGIAEAE